MEYYNNYPVVFIHGLTGWGDGDLLNDKYIMPYFGWGPRNIPAHLEKLGYECYTPTLGPFNSAWDRACIFWAWLMGGTVDFGKVHSEKHGHARYGKTFEHGAIEDLGKTEAHKKMNILGHSFGGPTVLEIANLFGQGSAEEREGTDPEDLSPLFKGGHGHLLHTVTTLSGVNNGTTYSSLANQFHLIPFGNMYILMLATMFNDTPIGRMYNFNLQQWGIGHQIDSLMNMRFPNPLKYIKALQKLSKNRGDDNILYELTVEVMQEKILPQQKIIPSTYYFAQRAYKTKGDGLGHQIPLMPLNPICQMGGAVIGYYTPKHLRKYGVGSDPNWQKSDGLVPLTGQSAPLNQPYREADYDDSFVPGMWYNMPPVWGDHVWWNNITSEMFHCFQHYERMLELYRSLPDG